MLRPMLSPVVRRFVVAALLVIGLELSLTVGHASWPPPWKLVLAICFAGVVAIIPMPFVERLRHRSPRGRVIIAMSVAVLSMLALYGEAIEQERTLIPKYQDEFSYMLQARMIAHGKLWTPPHPLADFFESFQVITKPVYASAYFPGAAFFFAPGIWLHLPFWVMPLLASGLVAGVLYWIVANLIDDLTGMLATMLLISLPGFRLLSVMSMAQTPTLLFGLMAFACFLKWRENRSLKIAIAIGFFLGWCAITRPIDSMCFAIPIAIGVLSCRPEFAQSPNPSNRRVLTLAALLIGAAPFIALQIIANAGITGSPIHSPFGLYAQQSDPQTEYGLHKFDPSIRPASTLPQKQKYFDGLATSFLREHTPTKRLAKWWRDYLPQTFDDNLPQALLLILLPVGLLGLWRPPRLALFAVMPLFVILYFPYVFFLPHYSIVAAPAVILLALLGAHVVQESFPKLRGRLTVLFVGVIIVTCASTFRLFNRGSLDDFFGHAGADASFQHVNATLANLEHKPAVVLFRFGKESTPEIEPVYNIDVVNPDDAPVIRAHDLGNRSGELFDYYAKRQPDRAVYLFDRNDDSVHYLGNVRALAK